MSLTNSLYVFSSNIKSGSGSNSGEFLYIQDIMFSSANAAFAASPKSTDDSKSFCANSERTCCFTGCGTNGCLFKGIFSMPSGVRSSGFITSVSSFREVSAGATLVRIIPDSSRTMPCVAAGFCRCSRTLTSSSRLISSRSSGCLSSNKSNCTLSSAAGS